MLIDDSSLSGGKNTSDSTDLKSLETAQNNSPFNYNPNDSSSPLDKLKKFGLKHRRKTIIGVGAGGGIAGIIIAGFLALVPLKIETIVKNLENHFFAGSNSAVGSESNTIMKDFYQKYVGNAMKLKACSQDKTGAVISSGCTIHIANGKNPVVNLYRTYADAKVETMLADRGIELKYYPKSGTYYLKAPGLTSDALVGKGGALDSEFTKVTDRPTIRNAFHSVEADATLWQKVMLRYKIGRLLEQKYGIKRCVVACKAKDFFSESKKTITDAKYAAKIFLIDRVIAPENDTLNVILKCIINPDCSNKKPKSNSPEPCTETSCSELGGAQGSQVDKTVESSLTTASDAVLSDTATTALNYIKAIKDNGFNKFIIDEVTKKIFGKAASFEVPGVGEIQAASMVSQLITGLTKAPQTIKRLSYLASAASAVKLFMMYQSFADEIHTGKVNAQEVGSFVSSLSPGSQCVPSLQKNCPSPSQCQTSCPGQKGGSAGAEGTPLYSALMGGKPNTSSAQYGCGKSNTPVPSGQLVCPSEQLAQGNSTISSISNGLSSSGLSGLADIFNSTVGPLVNVFNGGFGIITSGILSLAKHLPGYNSVAGFAKREVTQFFSFLISKIVPTPFGPNMSGGRTFDMMAAGADVSGNSYAHNGIGGKLLTPSQSVAIISSQTRQAQQAFQSQPLFARIFSTSSTYSLISKIAMDVPLNIDASIQNVFANYVANPFAMITHQFSDILFGSALAQTLPQSDPFGVPQYGYTSSDLASIGDPQTYWDQNCSNNPATGYQKNNTWNNSSTLNVPNNTNDSFINTTTNPCMLIEATVGSDGGMFNSSLLTPSDLADVTGTGSSSNSTSASSGYQNPFRAITNLTPERIDQGVDYSGTGPIYAIGNGTVNNVFQNWYLNEPFIAYTLSDGPAAGKTVYVSECVSPSVSAGQNVTSSTVIGQMTNCGNGIETGWANTANLPDSMALQCWDHVSSSFGVNFSQLLQSIGAPAGVTQESNPPCTLPTGWPTW